MTVCPIDGSKIGMFSSWILKDGEICNKCGANIGLIHGNENADALAHSITVSQAQELYDKSEKINAQKINKQREKEDAEAIAHQDKASKDKHDRYHAGLDFSGFLQEHNLSKADQDAKEQIKKINNEMNGMRWYRGKVNFIQLNMPEQAKIANLTTQTEQNWLLINQNEELKIQNQKIINLLSKIANQ